MICNSASPLSQEDSQQDGEEAQGGKARPHGMDRDETPSKELEEKSLYQDPEGYETETHREQEGVPRAASTVSIEGKERQ